MSDIDANLLIQLQIIAVPMFSVLLYEVIKAWSYAWRFRDHEKWSCYEEVFRQEGFEANWSGLSREAILSWMKEFNREWSDSSHAWIPIDPNKRPSLWTRFIDFLLEDR